MSAFKKKLNAVFIEFMQSIYGQKCPSQSPINWHIHLPHFKRIEMYFKRVDMCGK